MAVAACGGPPYTESQTLAGGFLAHDYQTLEIDTKMPLRVERNPERYVGYWMDAVVTTETEDTALEVYRSLGVPFSFEGRTARLSTRWGGPLGSLGGELRVQVPETLTLEIRQQHGYVDVIDPGGPVRVRSELGDIRIVSRLPAGAFTEASAVDGNILLAVPPSVSAALEISTPGKIWVVHPELSVPQGGSRGTYRAEANGGAHHVRLSSRRGLVTVETQ